VHLAEDVERHAARLVAQSFQFGVGERGDDQQDCVGRGGAGFENLEGVEDEVLAQAGNRGCGGREGEIFERALKKLFVREDGERGRTGGLERAGQREGEAFFNSAMMAGPALRRAASKPRGVCAAALRSRSARSATALRSVTSS
jgi:hypothetical protein